MNDHVVQIPAIREKSEEVVISRAEELNAVGAKLFREGQAEPARLHFLGSLMLEPKNASAYQNLGATLRSMRFFAASEAVSKRCVTLTEGKNPYCLSNYGVALLGVKKSLQAYEVLREVTKALPEAPHSWHNFGLACYIMGRYTEALEAFDRSLALAYALHPASDRALTLLSLGRIQEALAAYEVRWSIMQKTPIFGLDIPEWQGEDLKDRRILVHHEQGFGDSLMLVRFVRELEAKGAEIGLAVPEPLMRLFDQSFDHVGVWNTNSEQLDQLGFDYHTPMLSMMRHMGIESPNQITPWPYLCAKGPAPVQLPSAKYCIGICWASGNHSPDMIDRRRLVPLSFFLPLLDDVDVALISLQKGQDEKDIQANGLEGIVFDPSGRITDFADTAAVINELDLVISVDSAVAHLAGALGKPCVMLSPYTRCWRWWNIDDGRPWYNNMAIFHQSSDGNWENAVMHAVAYALAKVKTREIG